MRDVIHKKKKKKHQICFFKFIFPVFYVVHWTELTFGLCKFLCLKVETNLSQVILSALLSASPIALGRKSRFMYSTCWLLAGL